MTEREFEEHLEEDPSEESGEEVIDELTQELGDSASVVGDYDRKIIQTILTAANGSFKYHPEKWTDLLARLGSIIDYYKFPNPNVDEDDIRAELQDMLIEARNLEVH